jgi:putative phosphoribosyl transferase
MHLETSARPPSSRSDEASPVAGGAMVFRDRQQGGILLAAKLEAYRDALPIVFGLTRGGVPVASEVARVLDAPLEPMVVRKVGAPDCPEYAIGAIAEGGGVWMNR